MFLVVVAIGEIVVSFLLFIIIILILNCHFLSIIIDQLKLFMNQDVLDLLEQYALYFIMILASTGSNCYYRRNCSHFFFLKWEIDALIISFETLKIN